MITASEYDYLEKRWSIIRKQERDLQKQLSALQKERERIERKLQEIIVEDED